MGKVIRLNEKVPKKFYTLLRKFWNNKCSQYVLKGGRGSTKSTVAAMLAVLTVVGGRGNALCVRRYATTLKGSCYNDVAVAIERLGVSDEFEARLSPMEFRHIPTGFVISFRGLDDPTKLKSIRAKKGNYVYLWFEECSEVESMAKCRNVIQSVGRGEGNHLNTVFTFNPPSSALHWVNSKKVGRGLCAVESSRFILHSSYLDVPPKWLGDLFLENALKLKEHDFEAYRNEYLGEIVNSKGTVFKNVKKLEPDVVFDRSLQFRGIDFGFTKDPTVYVVWAYDRRNHALYFVHEVFEHGMHIDDLAEKVLVEQNGIKSNWESGATARLLVYCDNQEPRSISSLVDKGVRDALGCTKGPDSIRHGVKWLQGLTGIYIPEGTKTYEEFERYMYAQNKEGEYIGQFKDEDNHSIDATRYACQDLILGYI